MGEDISKQIFFNGTLVTVTFFMISGFLLAYNLQLYSEKHRMTWWMVPKGIFVRWLRLTPVYALIMATTATLMRHAGKGPLWELLVSNESEGCRKMWWAHILYINNYMYGRDHCMPMTWYLASDIQLFALGLIICVMARTPRVQKIMLSIMFTTGIAILGLHTYFQNLDATIIETPEKFRNLFATDDTFKITFVSSHANLSIYSLGIMAGLVTYYLQLQKKDFSEYKRYWWMPWLSFPSGVFVMMLGGIFYQDVTGHPIELRVIFSMLHKPIFQILVVVAALSCIFKVENFQRRILEWPGWTWSSRVSYSAFLVHSLFQRAIVGIQTQPIHITNYYIAVLVIATLTLSFATAVILWLSVESPINMLIKTLMESRDIKKTERQKLT